MTDGRPSRRRWLPALAWLALIFTLTSIPNPNVPPVAGGDKLLHFVVYGVLGLLVASALAPAHPSLPRLALVLPALAAVAAVDEWHQQFIPGRSMSADDWVADVAGAGLALVLSGAVLRRRESR